MSTSIIVRIQVFLVALTSFVKIFRLSVGHRGYEDLASSIGSMIMYATILFSIVIIVNSRRFYQYLKYVYKIFLLYIILFILQKILTPNTTLVNFHILNFVLLGIGAFTVGYSMSNVNLYIKQIGIMSIFVGLIFFFEPITSLIMQQSNMVTGYTLMPICVFGLLYSLYSSNRIVKILAILPCITVSLFTSRGCGLSIVSFYIIALVWKNKLSVKKSILVVGILSVIMWILFSYVLSLGIEASQGSLIGKFLSGDISSDNGREYLLDLGWLTVMQHPFAGVGIDGDIAIIGRFIQDYPFIHNVVVELFLDFGIPVALLLILLYFTPIIKCVNRTKEQPLSLLLIAMLCAVWIRLFFSDSYINNLYSIMMLLGLAFSDNKIHKLVKKI